MSAAEDMGVAARSEAAERAGVQVVDVDRFERILLDRVAPPSGSGFIRTVELRGSPEQNRRAAGRTRQERLSAPVTAGIPRSGHGGEQDNWPSASQFGLGDRGRS